GLASPAFPAGEQRPTRPETARILSRLVALIALLAFAPCGGSTSRPPRRTTSPWTTTTASARHSIRYGAMSRRAASNPFFLCDDGRPARRSPEDSREETCRPRPRFSPGRRRRLRAPPG